MLVLAGALLRASRTVRRARPRDGGVFLLLLVLVLVAEESRGEGRSNAQGGVDFLFRGGGCGGGGASGFGAVFFLVEEGGGARAEGGVDGFESERRVVRVRWGLLLGLLLGG